MGISTWWHGLLLLGCYAVIAASLSIGDSFLPQVLTALHESVVAEGGKNQAFDPKSPEHPILLGQEVWYPVPAQHAAAAAAAETLQPSI